MKRELLETLLAARSRKEAVVLVTELDTGTQALYRMTANPPKDQLEERARECLERDRASTIDGVFYLPFNPPLRLFVVGAVHIAQAMVSMAKGLGFEVTVIDPRSSFGRTERFPGVLIDEAWPDEALEAAALDHRSAVITLTHDPKLDDPALEVALQSPAFYIGCLGSSKTHAARRRRLAKQGFDEAALDRLHGPLGLALGGRAPAEVALSALAEMVSVLRGGSARK